MLRIARAARWLSRTIFQYSRKSNGLRCGSWCVSNPFTQEFPMAKGQQKKSRENKKPKQNKADGGGKSAYAQSMSTKSEAAPFGKKK